MNRILFSRDEIRDGEVVFGGERAAHVLDVLHGEIGQTLKTGEIDGLAGTSVIAAISKNEATGERLVSANVSHDALTLEPWVDLILAPPRPRVLKRLLPQLAAMGVGKIVLTGAAKVEKDFWGATILKPEIYRPLLVEGLMQAGTTRMPELIARRPFRRFVADEMDAMFPSRRRLVAHPSREGASPKSAPPGDGRLLLAVGPEGGWTDGEVELLEAHGFARYSLGGRILRTDTALVALLARLG